MTINAKEIQDQLQLTEADLLESFSRLTTCIATYSNYIHTMDFTPDNSDAVNLFIEGIESLSAAFRTTIKVTRIVAEVKGVQLRS